MKSTIHSGFICQLLVLVIAVFVSAQVYAQDEGSEKSVSASSDILELKAFVDANGTFCNAFSPENSPLVQTTVEDWYRDNRIDNVTNIIIDVVRPKIDPELKLRQKHLSELESKVRARASDWCKRFVATLQTEKMNLGRSYTEKLQEINRLHARYVLMHDGADMATKRKFVNLPIVESPLYQEMMDAGVDLSITPVATEFRCYAFRPGSDYNMPDFNLQLAPNNTYKSSYGPGSYVGNVYENGNLTNNLTWIGTLGKFSSSRVKSNYKFGQYISFEKLEVAGAMQDYNCYQQGARETMAITRLRLRDPGVGDYECHDSDGERRSAFSIEKGFRYSAGKQRGRYTVDLRSEDDYDSEVSFVSGPLKGTSGQYKEQAGTGLKKFKFKKTTSHFLSASSSASLDMTCTSVGDATEYEKYGDESVPAPPPGSGGMSGLYAKRRKPDSTKSGKFDFYVFTPEGRVFSGVPDTGVDDIKCQTSYPSGQPRCNTYRVVDNRIILNNGLEDYKTLAQGDLVEVTTDVSILDGKYIGAIGDTSGFCSPFFTCSSWFRESVRQFTADGRFSTTDSSMNLISVGSGVGTNHGRGSSNSSTSGHYKIEGNKIHLSYDNGVVETVFIAILSKSTIHMSDWTYTIDNDK